MVSEVNMNQFRCTYHMIQENIKFYLKWTTKVHGLRLKRRKPAEHRNWLSKPIQQATITPAFERYTTRTYLQETKTHGYADGLRNGKWFECSTRWTPWQTPSYYPYRHHIQQMEAEPATLLNTRNKGKILLSLFQTM